MENDFLIAYDSSKQSLLSRLRLCLQQRDKRVPESIVFISRNSTYSDLESL